MGTLVGHLSSLSLGFLICGTGIYWFGINQFTGGSRMLSDTGRDEEGLFFKLASPEVWCRRSTLIAMAGAQILFFFFFLSPLP